MTEEMQNLGRRAVACKGWKWMPGMLACSGKARLRISSMAAANLLSGDLPDLSDPATVGCLLALVREVWGAPLAEVRPMLVGRHGEFEAEGWICRPNRRDHEYQRFIGTTEAAALVAALEAAP